MLDKEQIIDFYKVRGITELENSAASVGWSSPDTQQLHFKVLYNIGVNKEDTILDYGCGLGHLIDFLQTQGSNTQHQYFGIDILNEFILAAKKLYPGHQFQTANIYDIDKHFDYVFGSGTFTICTPLEEMLNALQHTFKLVNKGISFNLMNVKHKLSTNKYFSTYDPEKLLPILQSHFNNVEIINNYSPEKNFTVYIRK